MSKTVFFDDDDTESFLIMQIFRSTDFEINPMSGSPTSFKYQQLKDNIEWAGLKPKLYVNLLIAIGRTYIRHLPSNG